MNIINKPELKSFRHKAVETLLIAVGTMALKLVLIGFTLALWGFSFHYVVDRLFAPDALDTTVRMLSFLMVFALISFVIMLTWAKYNIFWYAKRDRRQAPPPLTPQMLAVFYNTDLTCITTAAACKIGTVDVIDNQLVFCDNEVCFPIKEMGKRS